jgi:hypothetical protein
MRSSAACGNMAITGVFLGLYLKRNWWYFSIILLLFAPYYYSSLALPLLAFFVWTTVMLAKECYRWHFFLTSFT